MKRKKSPNMKMKHLLTAVLSLAMFTPLAGMAQETYTVNDTIYNPKNLKAGDEVSIYYDGVFITKLKVEE